MPHDFGQCIAQAAGGKGGFLETLSGRLSDTAQVAGALRVSRVLTNAATWEIDARTSGEENESRSND